MEFLHKISVLIIIRTFQLPHIQLGHLFRSEVIKHNEQNWKSKHHINRNSVLTHHCCNVCWPCLGLGVRSRCCHFKWSLSGATRLHMVALYDSKHSNLWWCYQVRDGKRNKDLDVLCWCTLSLNHILTCQHFKLGEWIIW